MWNKSRFRLINNKNLMSAIKIYDIVANMGMHKQIRNVIDSLVVFLSIEIGLKFD